MPGASFHLRYSRRLACEPFALGADQLPHGIFESALRGKNKYMWVSMNTYKGKITLSGVCYSSEHRDRQPAEMHTNYNPDKRWFLSIPYNLLIPHHSVRAREVGLTNSDQEVHPMT